MQQDGYLSTFMQNFKKECRAMRAPPIIVVSALRRQEKTTLRRLKISKISWGGMSPDSPRRLRPMAAALPSALPNQKSWLRL